MALCWVTMFADFVSHVGSPHFRCAAKKVIYEEVCSERWTRRQLRIGTEPNKCLSMKTDALTASLELLSHTAPVVRAWIGTAERKCCKYPLVSQLLFAWQSVEFEVYVCASTFSNWLSWILSWFCFLFHFNCFKTSLWLCFAVFTLTNVSQGHFYPFSHFFSSTPPPSG